MTMRVDLLTREYPPHIYGGAGVHVDELAKVLRKLNREGAELDLRVQAFDGPREAGSPGGDPGVTGYDPLPQLADGNPVISTFGINLEMVNGLLGTDLVHSHTWYTNLAGYLAQQLYQVPLVVSAHSLEPLRPWKAEQLGGGYALSSFAERLVYENAQAIIAVSRGMKEDILRCYPSVDPENVHVIHNGIDLARWSRPQSEAALAHQEQVLQQWGIDRDRPTVVFVGRVTRQKGLPYFLRAIEQIPPQAQIVLCAGAPDTPEIEAEVAGLVENLRQSRDGVILISEMLSHQDLVDVISAGDVFVTPSVYEPLGIVNLEAMALELPVVGTQTGGIPDVIVDGETGYLVPIEQMSDGTGTPLHPELFETEMANRITRLLENPELAQEMGRAGRRRVEECFSWEKIGEETRDLYQRLLI